MLFNCTVSQLMIRGTFVYLQPTCPSFSLFSHLFQVFTWLSFKYMNISHPLPPSSVSTAVHYRHRLSVVLVWITRTHLCKLCSVKTVGAHVMTAALTSPLNALIGVVWWKNGFCATPGVVLGTLSGPWAMIFMSNMSLQLTSG